jgi:hypothetical protein
MRSQTTGGVAHAAVRRDIQYKARVKAWRSERAANRSATLGGSNFYSQSIHSVIFGISTNRISLLAQAADGEWR